MTSSRALAVELDALGDTRSLWSAWLESARNVLDLEPADLPSDRGEAAAALDRVGAGNWRTLLERFTEDHAAAFLRRDAATSAALRSLASEKVVLGVFTDAPEPLARVALTHLGATRRVGELECGADALGRLLARIGEDAVVVRTRDDLLAHA